MRACACSEQAPAVLFLSRLCGCRAAEPSSLAPVDKEGTETWSTLGILFVTREAQGNDVRIMSSLAPGRLCSKQQQPCSCPCSCPCSWRCRDGRARAFPNVGLGESRVLSPDWRRKSGRPGKTRATGEQRRRCCSGRSACNADAMLLLLLLRKCRRMGGGRRI